MNSEADLKGNFEQLVGTYQASQEGFSDCLIRIDSGALFVDSLPQVWTRTKLLPVSPNVFQIQSLPIKITFIEDEPITMHVTGPNLLDGAVDYQFTKKVEQSKIHNTRRYYLDCGFFQSYS